MTTIHKEPTTINKVVTKDDKREFLGYLVKSNSSEDWHKIIWSYENKRWECDCGFSVGHHHMVACPHVKVINQVIEAKNAMKKVVVVQQASNVYTFRHSCGHEMTKAILESTPYKQKKVLKWLQGVKCAECCKKESLVS